MQKCALMPVMPSITTHGHCAAASGDQCASAGPSAMTNCMNDIQNRMHSAESRDESFFVTMCVRPKASAPASMASAAGSTVASPGRRITSMPVMPSTTAVTRAAVSFSRRKIAANTAVHNGVVNSIANTVASGIRPIA